MEKMNVFKRIWYSITKYEKYPEMASHGVKKAIIYFTELMIIFSILFLAIYVYHIENTESEEQLNLSEKIVNELSTIQNENMNEELSETLDEISNYSTSTMIIILFISIFIAYFITTLLDVFLLSLFGLITCMFAKMKINYKAVFNMSVYAITLPLILKIIYAFVLMVFNFEIKYFDIMYTAVSYIILAAAIFMIKSDVVKQQLQLIKIIEENKEVIEEKIANRKKEEKEEQKEKEKKKENENTNDEEETEGQT